MMNPEIKARWVAWLRANAEKQTRGRLNRVVPHDDFCGSDLSVGFCCLGGLCELAVEDGVVERFFEFEELPNVYAYGVRESNYSDVLLPDEVVRWAGLENHDPEVRIPLPEEGHAVEDSGIRSLTELNDEELWNFHQIADIIEEQL